MSNYSLINRPSQILLGQANTRIINLLSDLSNPTIIQSNVELLGEASSLFNSFYNNLGFPLAVPIIFSGLPLAQEWNSYQQLLVDDLTILYTETTNINEAASDAITFNTLENSMLSEASDELLAKIASYVPIAPLNLGLQRWVVTDNFLDTKKIDLSNSQNISIINATIELSKTGEEDFTNLATIAVDDQYISTALNTVSITGASNGFAGNTHEVVVPENTNPLTTDTTDTQTISAAIELNTDPGLTIAFAGDNAINSDPSVMLDGNPTTWFEYEIVNIPDTLKYNPAAGVGFNMDVTDPTTQQITSIPWWVFHDTSTSLPVFFPPIPTTSKVTTAGEEIDSSGNFINANNASLASDSTTVSGGAITLETVGAQSNGDTLRLVLNATFAIPQRLTQISILPNTINNKRPSTVAVAIHSPDISNWIVATKIYTDDTSTLTTTDIPDIFAVPETLVTNVQIVIEQNQSYQAQVGHIVWAQQESLNDPTNASTLNSLVGTAAIGDTDISSNSTYIRTIGPSVNYNKILKNSGTILDNLTGIDAAVSGAGILSDGSSTIIGPFIEVFDGWRYAIAIRDISFTAVDYVNSGIFVTQSFNVPVDIKVISLEVDEVIAETVVQTTVNWLTYQFSLDNGTTWTDIAPRSHYTSTTPRKYLINPSVNTIVNAQNSGTLVTDNYDAINNPVVNVKLRANLSRTDDSTITPRLKSYNLILEGLTT